MLADVNTIDELLMYPVVRLSHMTYSTDSFVYLAESIHVLPPRFTSVAHHSLNSGAFCVKAVIGVVHGLKLTISLCVSEDIE